MNRIELPSGAAVNLFFRTDTAPFLLLIPGGGYNHICPNEAENLTAFFLEMGFHCGVLHYRVAPERAPAPQQDAFEALAILKKNAQRWALDKIAVCGFSAGGHLAACCGCLAPPEIRPDAMILCYPVITTGKFISRETIEFLLGEHPAEYEKKHYSLECQVDDRTPPAFCWHTEDDKVVPVENTLLFASAMHQQNRICETHIFPHGRHGLNIAAGIPFLEMWPSLARNFLKEYVGFQFPASSARGEANLCCR